MSYFPEPGPAAAPALQEFYGFVPRVFRLQAAAIPDLSAAEIGMLGALMNEEFLSRIEKEKIMFAVSAASGSSYGVALHGQMLRVLGAESGGGVLARFAELLAAEGESGVDGVRSAGFTDEQIVEAIVLTGFCRFLNTVQAGTGVAPDFAVPSKKDRHLEPAVLRHDVEESAADPDEEWVEKVQQGDLEAFEVLVERHSQRVYRTLVGLLGNPDEAKDALQDTFLKAFQNLPGFERRARFSTWLVSIAGNTGLQRLRERKQVDSLDDDEEFRPRQIRAWSEDPEQLYSKSQRKVLVERSILRLPAKYRVVVLLRDVQQLSTEESAAALGLGIPALKARLLRGRLMLREALAPHFMEGAQRA